MSLVTDHYKIGGMGADEYKIGPMGEDIYLLGPAENPTHGKFGAVYRQRPNNFKGTGLNDVTLGTGFSGAASRYYEVQIDSELGGTLGVDTFQWRANGGAWTTGVDISGAAQTLDNGQQITFAATTGHTDEDQWTIGNFKDEPCTESGVIAQITDADYRILNMNSPPTFTDAGGATVQIIDYVRGKATFDANVGAVDVDGNNGFIVRSGLDLQGYIMDWTFNLTVPMADSSRMGKNWTEALPGQVSGAGSANSYLIGAKSAITEFTDNIDGTALWYFMELFTYDPAQDGSGDHFQCWASITGLSPSAPIGEVVKEPFDFQINHIPAFIGNT